MKKIIGLLTLIAIACSSNDKNTTVLDEEIRGADLSYLPLIESEGTIYTYNNQAEDPLTTLKNAGVNTIRIRLWHTPNDSNSSLTQVKDFATRIKQKGMKVWISLHYSDTWADPSSQTKPAAWESMNFVQLKNAVAAYTTQVINEVQPDIIQIGNETNDGMLWPEGRLSTNENQYLDLVATAITAIRNTAPNTKIMLHYAGTSGAEYYFNKVGTLDFDYIGLSYYPLWHGKNLKTVQNTINTLGNTHNKDVMIAETAYPFTLDYNDFTNNIVGQTDQLIPAYAPTETGQKEFVMTIKNTVRQSTHGIGFCYWEAEWVAFRGPMSTNGSPWENQSLWDFNNNALPVLDAFSSN